MTYKIAVSKSNIDVGTATSPNSFNYSSDYNTLKYYAVGSIQLSGSAIFPNTTTKFGTITHNLGYIPFFAFSVNAGAGSVYYPYGYVNVGAGVTEKTSVAAGTSDIRFKYDITNTSSGTVFGTVTFFLKIFRNNTGL